MATQGYLVTPHAIATLFTWVLIDGQQRVAALMTAEKVNVYYTIHNVMFSLTLRTARSRVESSAGGSAFECRTDQSSGLSGRRRAMTGLQPYPTYRDSGVGWGTGGGGGSAWAAMWAGLVPWVTGPLVVRERSGRDVQLRVYIDTKNRDS